LNIFTTRGRTIAIVSVLLSSRRFLLCLAFSFLGAFPSFPLRSLAGEPPASQDLQLPAGPEVITIHAADWQEKIGPHFHAKGKVEVHYRDVVLKADEIWGDEETRDVEGKGRVSFRQGNQHVEGTSFVYNLKNKTGTFYRARGKIDPGLIFDSEVVEKLGEGKYRIKRGVVTACEDKIPKWSFVVQDAVFQADEHVTAKNTTLRIKKIPVFFFPYLIAPIREQDRQTGFLLPSTGNSSSRGRSFSDSFYLTLGRSADLLTTAEYFSKRGISSQMEFRAKPTPQSNIYAQGVLAREYLLPPEQRTNGESARIIADNRFQNGFRAVADIDLVSSQAFRQLYGDSFATIIRPDKVSVAYLSKNYRSFSLNFLGERRLNRFAAYLDDPSNNVVIRKIPSVNFSGPSRRLRSWPLFFSFDLQADGLARSTLAEGGDHLPQGLETAPLVGRMDLFPRLTLPVVRSPVWSWTNSFSLRETVYSQQMNPANSTEVTSKALFRTAFFLESQWKGPGIERIYDREKNKVKHVVTPEVTYRYITGSDNFGEAIRFDDRDALANSSEIECLVNNRFYSRKKGAGDSGQGREFLMVQFGQKYFFDPTFGGALVPGKRNVFFPLYSQSAFAYADSNRRFSPVITRLRFTPAQHYAADFRLDYDPLLGKMRAASVAGSLRFTENFLMMTYYTTRNLPPNQVGSNQLRATLGRGNSARKGLNAAFAIVYDFRESRTQYSTTQIAYNWDCCGISLEQRRYNVGIRVESQTRFSFWLKNVGSFGNLRKQEQIF
jgi:LPS-assembly protein